MQVDLGAAFGEKKPLGFGQHQAGITAPAMFRADAEVIDPAAMAFVTNHGDGDDLMIDFAHQKKIGSHLELPGDILVGIIVGPDQTAPPPQSHDWVSVTRGK